MIKNRAPEIAHTICKENQRRGLLSPSDYVILIWKTAERVVRSTPYLTCTKNILEQLMIHARKLLFTQKIFTKMDMLVEKTVLSSHRLDLINLILKKYFNIRLYHEAKCSQENVKRIRTFHNKLVLFKNQ